MRLTVHYDGSAFHGWQVQPDRRTVQGDLEAALSRLADRPCSVMGSGRTDSGVHATGQVAAVDMPASWNAEALRSSLNSILPRDVWIETATETTADFHPRYDALRRTYRYDVGLCAESRSPFHVRWCWPLAEALERDLLDTASTAIIGRHSFQRFAKSGQPERGFECHIIAAAWAHIPLGIRFTITADRYLHHMVRYLVGTMVDIGRGRREPKDIARLLSDDADLTTSPPAPAEGLFLVRVEYPDDAPADPQRISTSRSSSPR